MVVLTLIISSELCCNTGIHLTGTPNTHLPCVYSAGQSVTSSLSPPGRYLPHNTWRETLMAREEALRNRHMKDAERLKEHTKRLPQLSVGDHVRIQNQVGPHPLKWDKTGIVIAVRQFDQYAIRVDGSGRVTLRNRKFLRRFIPMNPSPPKLLTMIWVYGSQKLYTINPCMRSPSGKPKLPQATTLVPKHPKYRVCYQTQQNLHPLLYCKMHLT